MQWLRSDFEFNVNNKHFLYDSVWFTYNLSYLSRLQLSNGWRKARTKSRVFWTGYPTSEMKTGLVRIKLTI